MTPALSRILALLSCGLGVAAAALPGQSIATADDTGAPVTVVAGILGNTAWD